MNTVNEILHKYAFRRHRELFGMHQIFLFRKACEGMIFLHKEPIMQEKR